MLQQFQNNKYIIWLTLLTLFLYHLPFLTADPDIQISFSRDAFTDEGLYSAQLRNYLSGYGLDISSSDNLVKSPLFSLILFLPLKLFGQELYVARLCVLILTFICYLYTTKDAYWRRLIFILSLTVLTHYVIFQYNHYALAEMLSSAFILLSVYFLSQLTEIVKFREQIKHISLACLWVSLAYYTKFQFIYIALLPIISVATISIIKIRKKEISTKQTYKLITAAIAFTLVFAGIYYLTWYHPNKTLHDYVISYDGNKRYPTENLLSSIYFNFKYYTKQANIAPLAYSFLILFLIGTVRLFYTESQKYKTIFLVSFFWILLELHKAPMLYLPTRYLVSFYFACGLCSALVISELWNMKLKKLNPLATKVSCLIFMMLLFSNNVSSYVDTFQRREYQLQTLNAYFKNIPKEKKVLGSWGASLLWGSKAYTVPGWKNYFNDQFIFKKINPNIIVSELDEEDSNQSYRSKGIDLESISDSTKNFAVGKWQGKIYWINQQKAQVLN